MCCVHLKQPEGRILNVSKEESVDDRWARPTGFDVAACASVQASQVPTDTCNFYVFMYRLKMSKVKFKKKTARVV